MRVIKGFFTSTGKFSYKCVASVKLVRSTRNDNIPAKTQRSLPASDATKQVISAETQLNLPKLTSSESLSVQTRNVRLKAQTTVNLVEKLPDYGHHLNC